MPQREPVGMLHLCCCVFVTALDEPQVWAVAHTNMQASCPSQGQAIRCSACITIARCDIQPAPSSLNTNTISPVRLMLHAGALIGCYESTRFKSKPKPLKLKDVHILGLNGDDASLGEAVKTGVSIASGNLLTRCSISVYFTCFSYGISGYITYF